MMGFITLSGSSARTIGPLIMAKIYDDAGPLATFSTCIGLLIIGTIVLLIFIMRLVPYSVYIKKKNKKLQLYVRLDHDDDYSNKQMPT